MKKIILLVLGMVFLTNCGDNVAVKPENRESFTENPYFKSEEFLALKNKEKRLQYIKENEYNTFSEALEHSYIWGDGFLEKVLNMKRNKKYIKEIEKVAKSKFVFVRTDTFLYICFTTINPETFGKAEKYNIVEVRFYIQEIDEIKNVEEPRTKED